MNKLTRFILLSFNLLLCSCTVSINNLSIDTSSSSDLSSSSGETLYVDAPEEDLSFWLGDELNQEKVKKHTIIPGWFGAEEYLDSRYEASYDEDGNLVIPNVHVTYLFNGYPDMADIWRVSKIEITDPDICFYGLSLNSDEAKIDRELTLRGFARKESSEGIIYSFGRISFSFYEDSIVLLATSANNGNIIF